MLLTSTTASAAATPLSRCTVAQRSVSSEWSTCRSPIDRPTISVAAIITRANHESVMKMRVTAAQPEQSKTVGNQLSERFERNLSPAASVH